jgi:PAS domain S-box-containing protein
MVEDDTQDAELTQRELRKNGLQFTCAQVCTREEFLKELTNRPPDIIFSDHGLPTFNGCEARALARKLCPQIPFIFVTGGIGEVQSTELSESDTPYLLKNELSRLPNMLREILQTREPLHQPPIRVASAPALKPPQPARRIDRRAEYGIILVDSRGTILSWNNGASRLLGFAPPEIIGKPLSTLFPWRAVERRFVEHLLEVAMRDGGFKSELLLVRQDSSQLWIQASVHAVRSNLNQPPTGYTILFHGLNKPVDAPSRASSVVGQAIEIGPRQE